MARWWTNVIKFLNFSPLPISRLHLKDMIWLGVLNYFVLLRENAFRTEVRCNVAVLLQFSILLFNGCREKIGKKTESSKAKEQMALPLDLCLCFCLSTGFNGLLVRRNQLFCASKDNKIRPHCVILLHSTCSLLSSCFLAERSCSRALLSWTLTSVLFNHTCRGSALASNSVIWDCKLWKHLSGLNKHF